MESIILKGDDNRVKQLAIHDLLGRSKPQANANQPANLQTGEVDPACQTEVKLLRVDDQVRGLEVHCSCGEITVVELTYPTE